jgi:hypothetical protein
MSNDEIPVSRIYSGADSSVGTVTRLGWTTEEPWFDVRRGQVTFSFSEVHTDFCSMSIISSLQGGKETGA